MNDESERFENPKEQRWLVFRYVEAYWLIMPSYSPGSTSWGTTDAAALLALGGTAGLIGTWLLARQPLLAQGDPLLAKALEYEAG